MPASALAEQIFGARKLAVAGGGHLLLGHGKEVKAEVTRFLRMTFAEAWNIQ